MHKTAYQARINQHLKKLSLGQTVIVSKSAVSKRRNEFDHTPFEKMVKALVHREYTGDFKRGQYKGFTILGIDGSYLQLPREQHLRDEFGVRGAGDCPMAGISTLYDVLHGWPLDVTITHSKMNERTECYKHIEYFCDQLPAVASKSIVTLDRGYASLEMFSHLQNKGLNFVIRCPKNCLKEIQLSPSDDSVIDLRNGQKIRVVKTLLESGELEILATNLFDFTTDEIIELYELRWCVETMYSMLKGHLFMEGFSGKTVNSIYQDFYATWVIFIGVVVFEQEAAPFAELNKQYKSLKQKARRVHESRINSSNTISTLRDNFIFTVLFHPDKDQVLAEIWKILQTIALSTDCVRPGRSFPRKIKQHIKVNHKLKVR